MPERSWPSPVRPGSRRASPCSTCAAELPGPGGSRGASPLDQVAGREPSPEFAAEVADQFRRLLALLPTEELRAIAVWKMEGYCNQEIAGKAHVQPTGAHTWTSNVRCGR